MKKWWVLPLLLILISCGDKKIDFSGNVPVKKADFIAAFPKIIPPFSVADTNIIKLADSLTIGYKVLLQFFPDSSLTQMIGNNKKQIIHPVGIIEKEKENYFLINFTNTKKITKLGVFVTDKKNKFLASKQLLSNEMVSDYTHTVSINREPTFLLSKEKMGKENTILFSRTGWVYNSMGIFMVVVNDSNEEMAKASIINPIDTLLRKNKYSGEYDQDKKNFISIRDSKKQGHYLFFIHFEKNDGSCIGELKGEMRMKNSTSAQYTGNGDPCIIDFQFLGNEIAVKEQGSCGNHRGIKCFFNDTYLKKKEPRRKK